MNSKHYKKDAIKLLGEALSTNLQEPICSDKQINLFKQLPKKLYKYSSFTEYSLENFVNEQLYIAPIESLDDQFEARINFHSNLDDYYQDIKEMIIKKLPNAKQSLDGVSENDLLDIFHGKNIEEIANKYEDLKQLPEITKQINDDNKLEQPTIDFFNKMIAVRKEYGVCSLSENNNSQIMWQMYAKDYSGFCIEYDIEECTDNILKANIFPVTYIDKRENDPFIIYMNIIISSMAKQNQEKVQKELYKWVIDLFTTKNKEWGLQKEWRVIGKAGNIIKAPKITSLYLGNKMSQENKDTLIKTAKERNIDVFEVAIDYEKLKIAFVKIDLDGN